MKTPINSEIVDSKLAVCEIDKMEDATIRDVVRVVNMIEEESGEKFIRMEMGVPGLAASKFGIEAEKEALDHGVAAAYPMLEGVKPLKEEGSKFIKNFMGVDLDAEGVIPTVGSMQGGYASFMAVCSATEGKDTMLFIDPGFPVQKTQMDVLGMKYETFDIYNHRGDKLEEKLESIMSKGNIAGILYSNPNNPAWICMNEDELKTIGEIATKYDAIVLEDLAYFAMDFRTDLSKPGVGPYQPTVAKYTDNYILMISSSKAFSYAGQRIGLLCVSDKLFHRRYENLKSRFGAEEFGYTMIYRIIYTLSSGTSHSAQYGLHGMLKAANEGKFNFVEDVREYGERAKIMKKMFIDNGFELVYSNDLDMPLADGFYFTIAYPGLTGPDLNKKLLYYGISAICLNETGSLKEGLRACVSQVGRERFEDLEYRLKEFHKHNQVIA
ncbi:pyridoxal phosphate-dependent aminotransferase [Labilibaculum sp. DW002]|uniref:Pyridoxal phosphate-dependent aminotransferase n=1 Tax=Paralabilibaculum antarcticum TaxID=2912572 RepID=A0ABT5VVU7_9BACT|nr:pyridoxal phosphate-dependent aminotransferase [Labilibaculum sp. DW002]MDE5418932.1 pyridoxal phosphate-dependent aminotransferase [Labilibaculum sp. DW002]